MTEAAAVQTKVRVRKNSEFMRILKQLSYNKLAMFGAIVFVAELMLVLFAPLIAPYGYADMDMTVVSQGPSLSHLCGTDDLGRDIFSRLLYGGRYSITMGIFSIGISATLGVIIGSIAGYFGGQADNIIMRVLDVIQSLPGMLLTICLLYTSSSSFCIVIRINGA